MAFEGLSEKLNAAFKRLRGKGRVTEADVKEAMKEVRLALLDADVSYSVVKDFVAKVTERAVGADVPMALCRHPDARVDHQAQQDQNHDSAQQLHQGQARGVLQLFPHGPAPFAE